MYTMQTKPIFFCLLVVWSTVQPSIGLVPAPRINEETKYSMQETQGAKHNKQQVADQEQQRQTSSGNKFSSDGGAEGSNLDQTDDDSVEDIFAASNNKQRIIIGEPYNSLIQTTARLALAQTSVTSYVNVDTFMDLLNDTAHMLSHPDTQSKFLPATAVILISLVSMLFFIPSAFWRQLEFAWPQPGKLFELEKYLPNGLNEMGIVTLLNDKTYEMMEGYGVGDSACRQRSVCQIGDLLRCTFPKTSKQVIKIMPRLFSRPKYRSNRYFSAFLTGFVDRACETVEIDQSKGCVSHSIASLSTCPSKGKGRQQATNERLRPEYQTLKAERA